MGALVEGRMGGDRDDDFGRGDAAGLAGVLAVGQQGADDAFGAAVADHAADLLARRVTGHRLAVQHICGHGDDFGLEAGLARAHVAL